MTEDINTRQRYVRPAVVATHKFAVGVHVAHNITASSGPALFRVTRHLPDGGKGLQYRIKADRDGQERVVVEAMLKRVS